MTQTPRIAPGTTAQIGPLNALITAAIGLGAGTGRPPHLFTTIARHRRLFRPWLRFASALMPRGSLPRADSELLILRVDHNCRSEYEWRHHERIGLTAGLSAAQIAAVRDPDPSEVEFDVRQLLLLRAADELHGERDISDQLWAQLSGRLSDVELIELCMLVGHYEMLAMTLNSLRVEPDVFGSGARPRLLALARRR
jgi:alkylhydroperoxidase family enzyme